MISDYWCCIVTRDGAETIETTIDSIISQTATPRYMVVINDGSTDGTEKILVAKSKVFPNIHTLNTGSKTRDIRRVPRLLNLGLDFSKNNEMPKTRYMMVSGDDNRLSVNYSEKMMDRMDEDPKLVVASGDWLSSSGRKGAQMPHGGGRFVKMSYLSRIGGRYPVAYGWETWLLYKAMQLGFSIRLFPDLRYEHLRPFHPKNLLGWGRAMYSLGFPTYFVLLRFLINFLYSARGTRSRQAAITMLAGFISAKLNPEALTGMLIEDKGLKTFVRYFCTSRLTKLI
ncbi:MAG TPA: glycosyltransferase family A protein [Nitrososphaerales archaeon]|nr:glycosyltransferase family A protein [Nitrososphaerales archaeon]